MADIGFKVVGDLINAHYDYVVNETDATRIITYGCRRFSTNDPNVAVARLADLFMGNLLADVKADEQRIAAAAAAESVTDVIATPKE